MICHLQGKLYCRALTEDYDLKSFSDEYLISDHCNREVDADYSYWQLAMVQESFPLIISQIGNKINKINKNSIIDTDFAYWIGMAYRTIHYITHLSSTKIKLKFPFLDLYSYYLQFGPDNEYTSIDKVVAHFLKN